MLRAFISQQKKYNCLNFFKIWLIMDQKIVEHISANNYKIRNINLRLQLLRTQQISNRRFFLRNFEEKLDHFFQNLLIVDFSYIQWFEKEQKVFNSLCLLVHVLIHEIFLNLIDKFGIKTPQLILVYFMFSN